MDIKKALSHYGKLGVLTYYTYAYWRERGRFPNFIHPSDLCEFLLSRMLKKGFKKYARYADKVLVRDYVKSKGLEDNLLEVYGVWDSASEINFSKLPQKFALKPNNGSGGHYLCKDKNSIQDEDSVRALLTKNLKLDYEYVYEPHYLAIVPKIYCEELIDTGTDAWPTDYKFTCINGEIVDVFVCCERESGHTRYITLNTNWEQLPYTKKEYLPSSIPEKPVLLDKMIDIAHILSKDFDFVRVDLYEYKNKVYFGELTFSPWGGFMHSYTNEAIDLLGQKLTHK